MPPKRRGENSKKTDASSNHFGAENNVNERSDDVDILDSGPLLTRTEAASQSNVKQFNVLGDAVLNDSQHLKGSIWIGNANPEANSSGCAATATAANETAVDALTSADWQEIQLTVKEIDESIIELLDIEVPRTVIEIDRLLERDERFSYPTSLRETISDDQLTNISQRRSAELSKDDQDNVSECDDEMHIYETALSQQFLVVERYLRQLKEHASQIKNWIGMHNPQNSHGHGLGVAAQLEADDVTTEAEEYVDYAYAKIDLQRTTQILKKKSTKGRVDEMDQLKTRMMFRDILNELRCQYLIMFKVVTQNRDKLQRPRGRDDHYLTLVQ